ncbi:cell division protein FtsK [Bacillus canaveralius]|uniref:Cell division protein FtsK n=1 Tax=Bacillus canaveralius TaxID=1403243 RepID=A0A2N5GPN1_9BACI|nr:FtsK/SpoIIIE domain-containing protein [Bacillus canaveralius]PLR84675.1 cell division protein FtsK [Bacillus canaveralius]PLS00827.1 cell division protein FtsK [Bacillus canaveralius]
MIEWLAVPLMIAGAALIPKKPMSDQKKIEQVFVNRKVGIIKSKDPVTKKENIQFPKLQKKFFKDVYSTYLYSLPLGIPSESLELILPALKEALNKEVEYEFDGLLKLRVYDIKLPERWDYANTLIRPGTWEVPIGKNHQGVLYHDFEKYPHLLNGGVTRFGKTVFMKQVMNTLILNNPEHVEIYVLDLKAGLEFYKYKALSQVKEVACDVYESAELLNEITEQLKQRELLFREKGYTNIADTPIAQRTFIFVDEGAELSPNIVKSKEAKRYAEFCQAALSEIARIGGGLGYRLIYATQYPTKEAVPMQVKMNIVARLSFVCASQVSSRVLLDDIGAENLPPIPGRAIYLVEKKRTVQVPYIDDKMIFEMMEAKHDAIIDAAAHRKPVNDDRPARPGQNQTPSKNS